MSGKDRRSFSIDKDLNEQLKNKNNLNASAVVNSLLRDYLAAGKSTDAALAMRKREIEQDIENAKVEKSRIESKIERLEREREDIQRQIEERRNSGIEEIQNMVEKIQNGQFPKQNLKPDNPAIENQAHKAQMTPERFISAIEDKL